MVTYVAIYMASVLLATFLLRLIKPKSNLALMLIAFGIVFLCWVCTRIYIASQMFQAMTVFGTGDATAMASSVSNNIEHSMISIFLVPLSIGLIFAIHKLTFKPPNT